MAKKKRRPLTPAEKQKGKEFVPSDLPRVLEQDVVLKGGKLNQKEQQYWHVFHQSKRVGKVFIKNQTTPKITVEINQQAQGIGIGRVAFRKACKLSQFDQVYALIRKGNASSIKAVELAGFRRAGTQNGQLLYKWERD